MIDVFDRPIADWDVVMKWLFDKFVGALLLLLALPAMALIAVAIKLDSRGPVLFKRKRYGFNNDLIEVYKFRSMYADKTDAGAARLVTKDDPRVTRVGRIIRKASLDELPQLFNVVFKGNLSLVGPRPHAVNAKAEARLYAEAVDGYFARHRVKPGITGWAQINGWRGETDTQEKIQKRIEHDLHYIENWSVLFDLDILLHTPFALLKPRTPIDHSPRHGHSKSGDDASRAGNADGGGPAAARAPAADGALCFGPVELDRLHRAFAARHDDAGTGRSLRHRRRPLRAPGGASVPAAAGLELRRDIVAAQCAGQGTDRPIHRNLDLSLVGGGHVCLPVRARHDAAARHNAIRLCADRDDDFARRHRRLFQPFPACA